MRRDPVTGNPDLFGCARDYLHHYLETAPPGHIRHDLRRCFELYINLQEHGAMLPDLDLAQFE